MVLHNNTADMCISRAYRAVPTCYKVSLKITIISYSLFAQSDYILDLSQEIDYHTEMIHYASRLGLSLQTRWYEQVIMQLSNTVYSTSSNVREQQEPLVPSCQ